MSTILLGRVDLDLDFSRTVLTPLLGPEAPTVPETQPDKTPAAPPRKDPEPLEPLEPPAPGPEPSRCPRTDPSVKPDTCEVR